MPGADNIIALKHISDLVVAPMLDNQGLVSGAFYFYNSG